MDVQQIDNVYKAKYRILVNTLGRQPTVKDPEYWELSNWYTGRHQELIDVRVSVERRAERAERYEEIIKPRVQASMSKIECRVCGKVIERTGGRGRPRVIHEECKGDKS